MIFPNLLAEEEAAPFSLHNLEGAGRLLILCDHAGQAVPRALQGLGLAPPDLERHIAWDIGARDIALRLAERFDAPAICGTYSRLTIDLNRYPWDPASCAVESDGTAIPANRALSLPDRERRIAEIFRPYHDRVALEVARLAERRSDLVLISVHSMTDRMKGGARRREEIAICWAEDRRLSDPLLQGLTARGDVSVGDNQPYALDIGIDYTLPEQAMRRGLPALQVEFRQDLVATSAGARHWADLFAETLEEALDALEA
ncbi:MAG: N-formylglutamate amidohydrolase [Rhodospirillales bacterium]